MKLCLVLIFSFFIGALQVQAASCCAGASAFPGVITTDSKAQVAWSNSQSQVVGDALNGEYFSRDQATQDTSQVSRLDAVVALGEFWQVGGSLSFLNITKIQGELQEEKSGLGDVSFHLTHEFLPELTYHPVKPRGFVFARLTLPTAPSVYDSQSPLLADVRGSGFYALGVGVLLTKTHGSWDFLSGMDYGHRFKRSFKDYQVEPGPVVSGTLGAGYSFTSRPVRLGLNIDPQLTEVVVVKTQNKVIPTSLRQVINTSVTLSYLLATEWSGVVAYNDQTLLGPGVNTPLDRSVSLRLQKRWSY